MCIAAFAKCVARKKYTAYYFIMPLSSPLNARNNRVQNRLQICKHSFVNLSWLREFVETLQLLAADHVSREALQVYQVNYTARFGELQFPKERIVRNDFNNADFYRKPCAAKALNCFQSAGSCVLKSFIQESLSINANMIAMWAL